MTRHAFLSFHKSSLLFIAQTGPGNSFKKIKVNLIILDLINEIQQSLKLLSHF